MGVTVMEEGKVDVVLVLMENGDGILLVLRELESVWGCTKGKCCGRNTLMKRYCMQCKALLNQ